MVGRKDLLHHLVFVLWLMQSSTEVSILGEGLLCHLVFFVLAESTGFRTFVSSGYYSYLGHNSVNNKVGPLIFSSLLLPLRSPMHTDHV